MENENKTKDKTNIYDLELHENAVIKTGFIEYYVTRVAGGWIYYIPRLDSGQMNSTFVPYNNEFQKQNGVSLNFIHS